MTRPRNKTEILHWWHVSTHILVGFWMVHPIKSATQICVVTRHRYGISALGTQMSFPGETSGSFAKCRLFSQARDDFTGEWVGVQGGWVPMGLCKYVRDDFTGGWWKGGVPKGLSRQNFNKQLSLTWMPISISLLLSQRYFHNWTQATPTTTWMLQA